MAAVALLPWLRSNKPPLDQVVALAGLRGCEITLAGGWAGSVVIKVNGTATDHVGCRSPDQNGRRFIENASKELRPAAHQAGHVAVSAALREVLVDCGPGQKAKTSF